MEAKFKVGDRVMVKDSIDARIRAFGEISTVTHIESINGVELCRIKYDFPHGVRYFRFYTSEIELAATPELKPCPFCGKSMQKIESNVHMSGDEHAVWCGNCGTIGPNELSKERAIELWNLRRPEAALETLVTNIGLLCAKSTDRAATLKTIVDAIEYYSKGR